MAYLTIEDFKAGLDTRRLRAALAPGSLAVLTNGHITRGGDIERMKKFVSTYSLPAGETFGMQATSDKLYVFGSEENPSVPVGVTYQRLVHSDGGPAMSEVLWTEVFDGKVYAIVKYVDDTVHHFYDGEHVDDWEDGVADPVMVSADEGANLSGIVAHLVGLLQADDAYITTQIGNTIQITAAVAGDSFEVEVNVDNRGDHDDVTAVITETIPNIDSVPETLASASFQITGGTNNAGVNTVSSVKAGGVELLSGAVDWTTSHAGTATLVAADINSNSAPTWTAVADGATVTVFAQVGTGDTPNGTTLDITVAGDVTVDNDALTFANGVDAATGQAQRYTIDFSGTFEVGDAYTVTITDSDNESGTPQPKRFGALFNPARGPYSRGTVAKTFRSKMYVISESLAYFSGVNNALGWNSEDNIGAGFINMANQAGGSEMLTALQKYVTYLAFFARKTIQIWNIEEDDDNNAQVQILENTGTVSPGSVISFGDNDVFYLDDSGVRSLRARDSSNSAFVSDVGSPIDDLMLEHLATLTDAEIEAAVGVIEPRYGRYWLAVGTKIFVFSFFTSPKISAWSTYEPGFAIDEFAVLNSRVYARSGDTIYLYGGANDDTYPDADELLCTVRLPYLNGDKPGHEKLLKGVDIIGSNAWTVRIYTDPNNEDTSIPVGTIPATLGFSYNDDLIAGEARSTVFAPELVCSAAGAAKLSKLTVYYDLEDPKA